MSTTRYYKVGGHLFSVSGEAVCFELMTNYEPFEVQVAETREGETCFALSMEDGFPLRLRRSCDKTKKVRSSSAARRQTARQCSSTNGGMQQQDGWYALPTIARAVSSLLANIPRWLSTTH